MRNETPAVNESESTERTALRGSVSSTRACLFYAKNNAFEGMLGATGVVCSAAILAAIFAPVTHHTFNELLPFTLVLAGSGAAACLAAHAINTRCGTLPDEETGCNHDSDTVADHGF